MRQLILALLVLAPLTGCHLTPAQQQEIQVIESDLHAGIADIQSEVDSLATDPSKVDNVEVLLAPYLAKNAALAKANADFLALWNNFKAGKVGPDGSPVTVVQLQTALAILDSLTGATTTAAARRQAKLQRLANKQGK